MPRNALAWLETGELLELFVKTRDYILRDYGADDRIVYGVGAVMQTPEIVGRRLNCLSAQT